jgi:hypothetical protein
MIGIIKLAVVFALSGTIALAAESGESSKNVKLRELAKGGFSGIVRPSQLVITNKQQWEKVWTEHSAGRTAQPLPEANFEKETVIFVGLGQKRTGGYSIKIDSAEKLGDKIIIHTSTKGPAKGAMTTQAITSPFVAAAIEARGGKIEIVSPDMPSKTSP